MVRCSSCIEATVSCGNLIVSIVYPRKGWLKMRTKVPYQNEIIARFEKLLDSYAKCRGLPRHCLGMNHVEGALLTIVDKQIDQPDVVLVGLAGLLGDLGTAEFAAMMMPGFGPRSKEEYERHIARTKRAATHKSAQWIVDTGERRRWRRRRPMMKSQSEYENMLVALLDEHFPPKTGEESSDS